MEITLGYGQQKLQLEIAEKNLCGVLLPGEMPLPEDTTALLEQALDHPIGTPRVEEIVRPGEKVVIITSDITRPMPTRLVLPPLLARLQAAGVAPSDITVVFAMGIHRHHTEEERQRLLGDAAAMGIHALDSDAEDTVHLGVTSRGTPVDIFRLVSEADRRICLGNIEYHYFAGYSGGAKAIMPGVSTRRAIRSNHSHMAEPAAAAGCLEGNPVRADIEEAVQRFCPVDFIFNVVLDTHKRIVYAVAGDVQAAHRAGCRFLDAHFLCRIPAPADIVVVSQGGAPKDLNLYQTQKALDNAKYAVRDGGTVILVGACGEGYGEEVFASWIHEANSTDDLIRRVRQDFQLGGHKAAAIAMVRSRAEIYFVSEMPADTVPQWLLRSFPSPQRALDAALARYGTDASVLIMPYGGSTLPRIN